MAPMTRGVRDPKPTCFVAGRVEVVRVDVGRVGAVRVDDGRVEADRVEDVRVDAGCAEEARVEAERLEDAPADVEPAVALRASWERRDCGRLAPSLRRGVGW